jgi:hypothetical protein
MTAEVVLTGAIARRWRDDIRGLELDQYTLK